MKKLHLNVLVVMALAELFLLPRAALAEDYVITLKDHAFSPADLTIPSGQKVKVTVKNLQSVPGEFESSDLNREKVVGAGAQIIVFVGPLDPGPYHYFDDFHRDSVGTITVK